MTQIPIKMNAARVVQAISRIGYSSWSAIMDIVDNSVTARADKINIFIEKHEDKFVQDKYSAKSYTIVDNGSGMDNEGIKNALMLGSTANYDEMSLSKYGMGLKSAGLSLGTKISVLSKQNNIFTKLYSIDSNMIEDEYFIIEEEISDDMKEEYNRLLENADNGTVIYIDGCESVENYSIKTTVNHLLKKMGVVYYEFLKSDIPIEININDSKDTHAVKPRDILFWDEAYNSYDHETYDLKKPCKILDTEIPISVNIAGNNEIKNALLKVSLFPQDTMHKNPNFTKEERDTIKKYEIGSENSGFYIYRNNRLIRWGEHIKDLSDNRMRGFRAKLYIYTEHDDVLHVDVSKQNLHLSEEVMISLKKHMLLVKKIHKEIFDKCSSIDTKGDIEGKEISERIEEFNPIDPDELLKVISDEEKEERQKRREKLVSKQDEFLEKDEIEQGSHKTTEEEQEVETFQRIRYSYKVKADYLWKSYLDPYNGHYIVINQNHVFYDDVISKFSSNSPERQAIEFLLFSASSAEGLTIEHSPHDDKVIEEVLDKYLRVMSTNLSSLINDNRDLFDK